MSAGRKVAAVVAVALHLLFGVFPFAASGLLVPLWGVALLGFFWLAMGLLLLRLLRGPGRRPFVALAVPFGSLAGWFAFVSFGEAVFDWTA